MAVVDLLRHVVVGRQGDVAVSIRRLEIGDVAAVEEA